MPGLYVINTFCKPYSTTLLDKLLGLGALLQAWTYVGEDSADGLYEIYWPSSTENASPANPWLINTAKVFVTEPLPISRYG